jgi:hypothetical protein
VNNHDDAYEYTTSLHSMLENAFEYCSGVKCGDSRASTRD